MVVIASNATLDIDYKMEIVYLVVMDAQIVRIQHIVYCVLILTILSMEFAWIVGYHALLVQAINLALIASKIIIFLMEVVFLVGMDAFAAKIGQTVLNA